MYQLLGWFLVALLLVMTAPFWLRWLNERTLHLKGDGYTKTIKALRAIHKPLGGGILLIALVHGYLALGAIRLHTGPLLLLALIVTASLGILFFHFKKKALFLWHKRLAIAAVALLLLHLIFPNALYGLFG